MASNKIRTPPSLPDDLIFYEIFPRLPTKCIHRILCVSTSCRRLTSDHQFHSAVRRLSGRRYHLSFAADHSKLVLYSIDQSGAAVAGEIPQKNPVHASTVNGLTFTVQAGDYSTVTDLVGHKKTVQGPYIATISNADTNETVQLPPVLPALHSIEYKMSFYLCHDPESKTDGYKVLRTAVRFLRENDDPVKTKCSIFTLGANMMTSSWRNIDLLRLKQWGDSKSVCINGTLYLTRFCDLYNNIHVIGAFVVELEKFYPVCYPAGLSSSRYDHCHLIELKGALAVIDKETYTSEIKLWVKEKGMFELGVDSWTELRIDIDPRWEMTFRISNRCCFSTNYDGEITFGVTGMNTRERCWIFTYNVEKGEWRRVEIQGLRDDLSITGDLHVEENLRNIFSLTQTLNPSKRQCLIRLS